MTATPPLAMVDKRVREVADMRLAAPSVPVRPEHADPTA